MSGHRLVVKRLPEGSVPPSSDGLLRVDPPALAGLRLVFGVGTEPEAEPTHEDFHPVYTISMPIFSLGGLDPDGIYEFDAGAQLDLLRRRATHRRWGVRLELELVVSSEACNAAELWIDTPWDKAEQPRALLLEGEPATTLPGGGRSLVAASTPVTSTAAARSLGGLFTAQLRDADPHTGGPASVESPVLEIRCDFGCYEFEEERES